MTTRSQSSLTTLFIWLGRFPFGARRPVSVISGYDVDIRGGCEPCSGGALARERHLAMGCLFTDHRRSTAISWYQQKT